MIIAMLSLLNNCVYASAEKPTVRKIEVEEEVEKMDIDQGRASSSSLRWALEDMSSVQHGATPSTKAPVAKLQFESDSDEL